MENEQDPIELISFAETYLKNPSAVWEKVNLDTKLKLQWFEFPSGIIFEGKKFRTPQIASIFNAKSVLVSTDDANVDFSSVFINQIIKELAYLSWILGKERNPSL